MSRDLHPISAIVLNESGVLARIAGLFARRGFNIRSLAVGKTDDERYARMAIVVRGDDRVLEQVIKQLGRLVDVVKVSDLADDDHVEREMALVRVHTSAERRGEVMELAHVFRAKIVDVGNRSVMVEASGKHDKIEALMDMLRPYGIVELARTGRIFLSRERAGAPTPTELPISGNGDQPQPNEVSS